MNKKNISAIVRLRENNNYIIQGINQNDAGVLFDMKVMNGLIPFDFSGYSVVTLKIQKPDGTFTYDSSGGSYVDVIDPINGRIKLNIPTSCTAQGGMHFCTLGFGADEYTYFETCSFNYFVGVDPVAEDEDVIGTEEFPILNNLIAQVAGIVSADERRDEAEQSREDAEQERQETYEHLVETIEIALQTIEDALVDTQDMIYQFNEAVAGGASVDITDIEMLATKTYVTDVVGSLDFGGTGAFKNGSLCIHRGNEVDIVREPLNLGEFAYAVDTKHLFIGNGEDNFYGKDIVNAEQFEVGNSAPEDTTKLWVDTEDDITVILYYDPDEDEWVNSNTAIFA